jgi:hypothetical protein
MAHLDQNSTGNLGPQGGTGQRADGGKQASVGIDPNSALRNRVYANVGMAELVGAAGRCRNQVLA